jgi:hypothetical protein
MNPVTRRQGKILTGRGTRKRDLNGHSPAVAGIASSLVGVVRV